MTFSKSCPFCGGRAMGSIAHNSGYLTSISDEWEATRFCASCGATITCRAKSKDLAIENAIKLWNARTYGSA